MVSLKLGMSLGHNDNRNAVLGSIRDILKKYQVVC